jgi:hypothetical protein
MGRSKDNKFRKLWFIKCEHCHNEVRTTEVEVNHKKTVLSIKEFGRYCENLFLVKESDLEVLCKPCHSIVTYSERYGYTLEEAELEKKVVKYGKLTAKEQKAKLVRAGIFKGQKNAKERKDAVRKYLYSKAGLKPK